MITENEFEDLGFEYQYDYASYCNNFKDNWVFYKNNPYKLKGLVLIYNIESNILKVLENKGIYDVLKSPQLDVIFEGSIDNIEYLKILFNFLQIKI